MIWSGEDDILDYSLKEAFWNLNYNVNISFILHKTVSVFGMGRGDIFSLFKTVNEGCL